MNLLPGQLVRFPLDSLVLEKFVLYCNGGFVIPQPGDIFTVISSPAKCRLPKHASKPEAWCEVMDKNGQTGALYPAKLLEVI